MKQRLLACAGLALMLAGCSETTQEVIRNAEHAVNSARVTVAPSPTLTPAPVATMSAELESMIVIDVSADGYSVDSISLEAGVPTTIRLQSLEGTHNLTIDALGVTTKSVAEGEHDTFTLTLPETTMPGTTYEYYCSVGDHVVETVTGTLRVE